MTIRTTTALLAAAVVLGACADAGAPTQPISVISAVSAATAPATLITISNVSATTGSKYAVVAGGLRAGAKAYTDRAYVLRAVPAQLANATYIQAPNDDKVASPGSASLLRFTVDRDVTVYVAHDDQLTRPAWLSGFVDTGLKLVSEDNNGKKFTVFKREFPAGQVSLGSNVVRVTVGSMYLVAVIPAATGVGADTAAPSVAFSTPTAGAAVSGTTTLSATASDNVGVRSVEFKVDGTSIAAPDSAAPYSVSWNAGGVAAGAHSLTATARDAAGNARTVALTVTVCADRAAIAHAGYYVSPTGTASGDGSTSRPWNLATALAHPSRVAAGDTIWLRGGQYSGRLTSTLRGTATAPIVVRQYPGERAVLDGTLFISGAYTWYWGFEVTRSVVNPNDEMAVHIAGPGTKAINMVVHDAGGNGFGLWMPATNAEVYGSIVYNNGRQRQDGNFAHGVYAQSSPGNTARIVDNVLFNQFGYGLHMYTETGTLSGFHVEGNAVFESGRPSSERGRPEILVGGGQPAERVEVLNNMTYKSSDDGTNTQLGYSGTQNRDLAFRDNYIAGGKPALRFLRWSKADVSGNTFQQKAPWEVVWIEGSVSGVTWARNSYWRSATDAQAWFAASTHYALAAFQNYMRTTSDVSLGANATGTRVFVRPNKYEPGRANVIVYNWSRAATASADMGGVLTVGDRYEVLNVRNLYGAPVAIGTYKGGAISIPVTAVPNPMPVGGYVGPAPTSTTEFQAYLVRRAAN